MVGEGGNNGREGREEDNLMLGRQRASVEEGRIEGVRVGEGNERGRDEAWTARWKNGSDEASGGGIERGREEGSKGGKLKGRYPEEGTGHYTVYSQTIPQRGPCHCYFVITNEK